MRKLLSVALVLLGGCGLLLTCTNPVETIGTATIARAIYDGAHQGHEKHFCFLPPMVPSLGYTGTFDASASPIVEISESGAAPFVTFTMTSGAGSELVRVDPQAELYIINWHTAEFGLDPAKIYTIAVKIVRNGYEILLGYADVSVVNTGGELKDVDTGNYIALLDDRTLPIKFRIEEGAGAVLYETDFSTDPGWETNCNHFSDVDSLPIHYRWVPTYGGTLFTDNYTNSGEWATKTIHYNGESFKLQFDVMPTERDTGDVCFGLFDSARESNWSYNPPSGERMFVLVGGYSPAIYVAVASPTVYWSSPAYTAMETYKWHHVEIIYDATSYEIDFSVRKDGSVVHTWQATVSGGFSANIDYLGVSMKSGWVTSGRHEVAYIDNVKMTREP